jgi:hypothetical protein
MEKILLTRWRIVSGFPNTKLERKKKCLYCDVI